MIGKAINLINYLYNQDKEKTFELKEFAERRSKSQNSYYWELVSKLAGVLRTSKDELHEELIRRYSKRDYWLALASVNPDKYFKYYDQIGVVKNKNGVYNSYLIYQRSSEMNKSEFRILLDGLISECEEVGIPTLTKTEIDKMKFIEK